MWLLVAFIYNFYNGSTCIGIFATWQLQVLELYMPLWMLMHINNNYGLGFQHGQFCARERARGGSSHAMLVPIDTHGLVGEYSVQAHQGACSSVA